MIFIQIIIKKKKKKKKKEKQQNSHWSSEDYDTAMIDSIEKARALLEKGLNLINKYYILF